MRKSTSRFSSRFIMAALALSLFSVPALARQGGDFGAGFQIGNPGAAISGKLWLNGTNALDMAVGFSPWYNWLHVQADYVWHSFNLIPVNQGQLPLYYGMGAMASISGSPGLGLRGVVGLEYLLPTAPLDVFLEVSPGAFLFPESSPYIGVGLGMRYFF